MAASFDRCGAYVPAADFLLLPPMSDSERRAVRKRLAPAHRHPAGLKGLASTFPNGHILINTLRRRAAPHSCA